VPVPEMVGRYPCGERVAAVGNPGGQGLAPAGAPGSKGGSRIVLGGYEKAGGGPAGALEGGERLGGPDRARDRLLRLRQRLLRLREFFLEGLLLVARRPGQPEANRGEFMPGLRQHESSLGTNGLLGLRALVQPRPGGAARLGPAGYTL